MRRLSLLSTTALALCAAAPALAATCALDLGGNVTCAALNSDPVASAADNVTVTVQSGASVVSSNKNATPVAMTGNAATVANDGLIGQTASSGYAITGTANGLTVTNTGQIASGDRGIAMLSGSNLSVTNAAGATIESRRQGIRAEENVTTTYVENHGTIRATEGRALQLRAQDTTVINHGTLIGGEEVVEARGGFRLENYGTIRLYDETVLDEDGVQFAGGSVLNTGTIRGTDDGIDLDEGLVENTATGIIKSLAADDADNSGIDIDNVYEDGVNPNRQNTTVTIRNAGLIEGPSAIGADDAATNSVVIENSGTLTGRGDYAIRLAPVQGDSTLKLLAGSIINGGVRFGAGNDTEKFWNMDLSVDYRLPQRRGQLSFDVRNLLDEEFGYESRDDNLPLFVGERMAALRLTLNF